MWNIDITYLTKILTLLSSLIYLGMELFRYGNESGEWVMSAEFNYNLF